MVDLIAGALQPIVTATIMTIAKLMEFAAQYRFDFILNFMLSGQLLLQRSNVHTRVIYWLFEKRPRLPPPRRTCPENR